MVTGYVDNEADFTPPRKLNIAVAGRIGIVMKVIKAPKYTSIHVQEERL